MGRSALADFMLAVLSSRALIFLLVVEHNDTINIIESDGHAY
jgi:hypothetical protein